MFDSLRSSCIPGLSSSHEPTCHSHVIVTGRLRMARNSRRIIQSANGNSCRINCSMYPMHVMCCAAANQLVKRRVFIAYNNATSSCIACPLPLAWPAMGHRGTCPLDFQLVSVVGVGAQSTLGARHFCPKI